MTDANHLRAHRHVDEEIKELTEAKKEIFAEAKSNGFDVKVIREVIRVREQDQKERDELETLLDIYLKAMSQKPAIKKLPEQADAGPAVPAPALTCGSPIDGWKRRSQNRYALTANGETRLSNHPPRGFQKHTLRIVVSAMIPLR